MKISSSAGSQRIESSLFSLFRSAPELASFTYFDERCDQFLPVFSTSRHIIRVETLAEISHREEFQQIGKRYCPFISTFFELCPAMDMIFRPEEIHCASGKREVVPPLVKRNGHIGCDAFWIGMKYGSVPKFYCNGESAIQTWTIDTNRFTWK